MVNKKIWIFGKNTVFSTLEAEKSKVYEIQILNHNLLSQINKKFHPLCKLVSEKNLLKKLKFDLSHQGIAACIDEKPNNKIQDLNGNVVILDNIYDHRNIGSIIRTSVAFGFNNMIIDKKNFSPDSPLMYKTASGAMEHINLFQVSNISNSLLYLKKNDYTIIAFDGSAQNSIFDKKENFLYKKIAFIFGSEDHGVRELTKKNCDDILKIPIKNVESLNVAVAVSSVLTLRSYFLSSSALKKSSENS